MKEIFNTCIGIIAMLILSSFSMSGQDDVTIHLDKAYYVAGEVVWYKLYLPEEFRSASGKVKVIVQNNNGQTVDESFVQLADAAISGYYRVPFDLESDLYHFTFSVLENSAKKLVDLVSFEVPIYNDLQEGGFQAVFPDVSSRTDVTASSDALRLDVAISGARHNLRGDISLSAAVKGRDGSIVPSDISIAIVDQKIIGPTSLTHTVFSKRLGLSRNVQVGLDERTFVQGQIFDATGTPAKVSVIGAYQPSENKMYYTKSDAEGNFTLLMKDQIGQGALQIAGYLYEEVADTDINLYQDKTVASDLPVTATYDESISNYLKVSNERKRIYQHFNQLENDLVITDYTKKRQDVKPNKSFKVKEYVAFESVGKFFDEILGSQLNFIKENGAAKARMFNPESNKNAGKNADYYFPRSPVFIIDGQMTKDADYIYNLTLDNIDVIDLYYDWRDITKQFGTFGDFGYVVIKTSRADVGLPDNDQQDIVSYNGLQPIVTYPIQISTKDRKMPQLKPLVYWDPAMEVSKSRDGEIRFTSSDDVSTFKVVVVARTKDGQVLSATTDYSTTVAN